MTGFEYDDIYKFTVSAGVVLISLAVLLPWLFLGQNFDASLPVEDLNNLTPTARLLIEIRHERALWFLRNILWISGSLAIIGMIPLVSGLYLWSKRQRKLEEKLNLELETADVLMRQEQRKLEKMTVEEIAEKSERQAELMLGESDEIPSQLADALKDQRYGIAEYYAVESKLTSRLESCLEQMANVVSNRRIQDSEYDIIAMSRVKSKPDVIFELKVSRRPMAFGSQIDTSIGRLLTAIQVYEDATRRDAVGAVVLLGQQESAPERLLDAYHQRLKDGFPEYNRTVFFRFLTWKELERADCHTIREKLFNFPSA